MRDSWQHFLDSNPAPIDHDPPPRLPFEVDETRGNAEPAPRAAMLQAYRDLMNGLVDTDLHGMRGVEEVVRSARAGR